MPRALRRLITAISIFALAFLAAPSASWHAAAATNLVGNPGFETDTSGWSTTSSTVSLTRVSGGHSGSWAAQLTNNGTAAAYCILNDSPNWVGQTATGTYTASLWVRADTAGAALKLKIREYSSANILLGQGAST